MVRLGLQRLFSGYEDMEVVGQAESGEDAVQIIRSLRPDVALMDIRMQGISGIEAARIITQTIPDVRVIMLTSFAEPEEVQSAFAAGASGYVLKNITGGNLVKAIRMVYNGEQYLDPEITEQVMCIIRGKKEGSRICNLSKREEEVLALVSEGKTNKEIGTILFLSEKTVRNNVSRILDKLGLVNRSQAAAYMARRNVIEKLHSNMD